VTSSLRTSTLRLPVGGLDAGSPLPILRLAGGGAVSVEGAGIDEEMRRNLAYGKTAHLLPYAMQDSYSRDRVERDVMCVVLENEVLTATFLPGFGGRLWSLVHRPSGRELLHRNPVLQPANLALRDAWLAGGVEWNLGTTGHWPLTCSPLHAVAVEREDGTPVLRMYEYERLRGLIVQLDFCLPAGAPVLSAHVTLRNPGDAEVPVYWWSNIAVSEAEDVRVLVPAEEAYHFDYEAVLRLVPFPGAEDRSTTTDWQTAADYFFAILDGARPWIAAVDADGSGLVHTSTARLRGRKLCGWGTGSGGRRWQEWLSGPDARYLEIQAGLARTQLEHLPMPPHSVWSWTEAYGLLTADPAALHGPWPQACSAAGAALAELVPEGWLAQEDEAATACAEVAPTRVLAAGSGWGALERRAGFLRVGPATPFPDETLGADQRPWLGLLDRARDDPAQNNRAQDDQPAPDFGGDPSQPPAAPMVGAGWHRLLVDRVADGTLTDGWAVQLHLGRSAWAAGDAAAAREAWQRSIALAENPWALRDLAESGHEAAPDLLRRAHALRPDLWQLTVETLEALLAADRPAEALAVLDALDDRQRALGRLKLLECRAALAAGDRGRAARLLAAGFEVHNLREGEVSLDALWSAVHPDLPLPDAFDFRMVPATG
jgi:hypothetical protein